VPLGSRHLQETPQVAQRKTTRKTSGKTRTPSQSKKKAGPSRKPKTGTRKRACSAAAKSVGDEPVTIDRRRSAGRRSDEGSAEKLAVAGPKLERRKKVNRRRQIDPTTCERDYTDGEVEFMNALDDYKRKSGRMFPTCSEVLEVVRSLGYVRLSPADFAAFQATGESAGSSAPTKWFASSAEDREAEEAEEQAFDSALAE
jgi:hypothetical protein